VETTGSAIWRLGDGGCQGSNPTFARGTQVVAPLPRSSPQPPAAGLSHPGSSPGAESPCVGSPCGGIALRGIARRLTSHPIPPHIP